MRNPVTIAVTIKSPTAQTDQGEYFLSIGPLLPSLAQQMDQLLQRLFEISQRPFTATSPSLLMIKD
jgi:hypothetical protein